VVIDENSKKSKNSDNKLEKTTKLRNNPNIALDLHLMLTFFFRHEKVRTKK
jgi:hypothetical protein